MDREHSQLALAPKTLQTQARDADALVAYLRRIPEIDWHAVNAGHCAGNVTGPPFGFPPPSLPIMPPPSPLLPPPSPLLLPPVVAGGPCTNLADFVDGKLVPKRVKDTGFIHRLNATWKPQDESR
jgi:hypothetical protein